MRAVIIAFLSCTTSLALSHPHPLSPIPSLTSSTPKQFIQNHFGVYDFPRIIFYDRKKSIFFVDRLRDNTKTVEISEILEFVHGAANGELEAEGMGSGMKGRLLAAWKSLWTIMQLNSYLVVGGTIFIAVLVINCVEPKLEEIQEISLEKKQQ
eukprot:TRINITY_DN3505_c0_g1_i1.p1 TRINITY_DN3505_c0_g1~~TRINITY_DN3505_c0_g1_i1.p1  ORF type:complete len:153 (+),score=46.65 TRINITY_DN3505_c0_g1_i1:1389-1847(+)